MTEQERFNSKYKVNQETGCWEWVGSKVRGYGQFWVSSKKRLVLSHRYTWTNKNGRVPDGMDLDHLCRNRCCCNPDHLEPVTRRVNMLRSPIASIKQTCPMGHPMSGDNLGSRPGRTGLPIAFCRSCKRESDRRRYWEIKNGITEIAKEKP